jgi:hypothetical protein
LPPPVPESDITEPEIKVDALVSDITSDPEDVPTQKPLVCVLWIAKAGQRKPAGYCLDTIDIWGMTYPQFVVRLNALVCSKGGVKNATNVDIQYSAKACKMAAKATELPKGFPVCLDFATCDSAEAYHCFLQLIRLNLAQMRTGTEPVIQIIGMISPKPAAAVPVQDASTTGAEVCDGGIGDNDTDIIGSPTRKVSPFRS